MRHFVIFIALYFISRTIFATERFVSLNDLAQYAQSPTAIELSTQLDTWTRQQIALKEDILKDQKLISVRPQEDFKSGQKVSFILFYLHNQKKLKPQSLLVRVSGVLNETQNKLDNLEINQVTNLSQTKFTMEVSLIDLTARLVDKTSGAIFVYPIGGSAFDKGALPRAQGKTIFASPAFAGTLNRNKAMESRKDPVYYRGKPFIRMIPPGAKHSLYGFHTTPFDHLDKHKPTETLARGYVSAGCLRMKDDDLIELYNIVAFGGDDAIPVEIKTQTEWKETHPYPILKDGYHEVRGFCWKKGEGNSPCLKAYEPGSRPVFGTSWITKDPKPVLEKLYDYGRANVDANGFSIK